MAQKMEIMPCSLVGRVNIVKMSILPKEGVTQVEPVINNSPAKIGDIQRCRLNHQVRKIPWGNKWQPTAVFLPGESCGQRNLVRYCPQDYKELDTFKVAQHARTQSNLQIQENPNQTINNIFHRTRANNFTIYREIQKTLNS